MSAQAADSSTKPFSFDTIEDFDKHIDLSIPDYSTLNETILRLSSYFVKDGGRVYDLGCSTGKLLANMASSNSAEGVKYVGIDRSENMINGHSPKVGLELLLADLTSFDEYKPADLVLSVFTLQFLPIGERLPLLRRIYAALRPGAALIVSEKLFIPDGYLQDVLSFVYYDHKRVSFTPEQIFDKQRSLRKIMRPLTSEQNEAMLREAGFSSFYPFWQSLLFKAWVCIK
ncbi:methyltransferase [Hymenobacter fodinae]|uniref:Methyltransferase domain-containing protein n=1 Tax=Hymenobacter fodinae TaxID=2510796 RepID=A0A4Z0P8D9_9BACT|nr:methyltransferase [Hymenobacter fodinae]TGE08270.1 methyltransferase domain-containing protein [Hymenobacter fodinae]